MLGHRALVGCGCLPPSQDLTMRAGSARDGGSTALGEQAGTSRVFGRPGEPGLLQHLDQLQIIIGIVLVGGAGRLILS